MVRLAIPAAEGVISLHEIAAGLTVDDSCCDESRADADPKVAPYFGNRGGGAVVTGRARSIVKRSHHITIDESVIAMLSVAG